MTDRMLEGQVALVTGAGRGLGRAFAERLAALGCHIAVHGMRENGPSEYGGTQTLTDVARAIAETHRVRTMRLLGDLTRMDDIERMVGTADSELGPIDILVHNAGGDIAAAGGKPDPNDVVHIKAEDVRAVLDRNLLSTIFVCQQVARGMMQRRRGRIITIGSVAAFKGRTNALDLCHRQGRRHALHALPRRPDAALRRHRQHHRAGRHPHRAVRGHARGRS